MYVIHIFCNFCLILLLLFSYNASRGWKHNYSEYKLLKRQNVLSKNFHKGVDCISYCSCNKYRTNLQKFLIYFLNMHNALD